MEVVLAALQEEEAMCDSSFQTAALPAGLTARRPHEAAQTQPREASSLPPLRLPQAPLTQSLAALPGACAGAAGWGGGCPSGTLLAPTPIPVWVGWEFFLPSVP